MEGELIRRYKRFLADISLPGGKIITAHVPNSGSMKTCLGENWPVRISRSRNPRRKLLWTLEQIRSPSGWIGVHTGRTNGLVEELLLAGRNNPFGKLRSLKREVQIDSGSRLDFYLVDERGEEIHLEVKSVTMMCGGTNCFPDAVTDRGRRHLEDLIRLKKSGGRAALFYVIQREGGRSFRVAREIDPAYARTALEARDAGVEFYAWSTWITEKGIRVKRPVSIQWDSSGAGF